MVLIGVIANLGSDVINNKTTAVPFSVPLGCEVLRLQPSAATQMAAIKIGDDSTFAPAAAAALQMGGANSILDVPIPRGPGTAPITLAIIKTDAGAATVKVFAIGPVRT